MKKDKKVHVSYLEIFASKKQQETPKKNIYNIHQALPRTLPIFCKHKLPCLMKIYSRFELKKHTIKPLTKKTRDEKF
jgi:hypothetical protein